MLTLYIDIYDMLVDIHYMYVYMCMFAWPSSLRFSDRTRGWMSLPCTRGDHRRSWTDWTEGKAFEPKISGRTNGTCNGDFMGISWWYNLDDRRNHHQPSICPNVTLDCCDVLVGAAALSPNISNLFSLVLGEAWSQCMFSRPIGPDLPEIEVKPKAASAAAGVFFMARVFLQTVVMHTCTTYWKYYCKID